MASELSAPREGIPAVLDTVEDFESAAASLLAGTGPIAIDTERASGFRFDDRAFLIQVRRRGVGTLLFAPEGLRDEFSAALAPALNGQEWVIHAAPSDLPSLAWLGLYPGTLFDTELAGRLAGFDHVNLAAMISEVFDQQLAKGHGAEDWSKVPLPENWLSYAALDVELLLELAEAMAEILDQQGKLEWAEEEFAYIRAEHADIVEPATLTWRDTKGVSTLTRPEQLAVARELWLARQSIAVDNDRAVSKVLPNKVLVEIARVLPDSVAELARVKGFPRKRQSSTGFWFQIIHRARTSQPSTWPKRERSSRGAPHHSTWANYHPEAWEALTHFRAGIEEISLDLGIPVENLLQPSMAREAVWAATETREIGTENDLVGWLHDHGAREWQVELVAPLLVDALFR